MISLFPSVLDPDEKSIRIPTHDSQLFPHYRLPLSADAISLVVEDGARNGVK